jgi:hypothetical protein
VFALLEAGEEDWLERPLQEEEVHQVLHSIDSDKALVLDGFTIAFFQSCWETVNDDLILVFHNFHEHGLFEKSLNATFLALIPKKKIQQIEIRDYIPISLVGSVYKILAKVLAIRMKQVLGVLSFFIIRMLL